MLCGIKFCGGCNPRYDRLSAAVKLKSLFEGEAEFGYAEENVPYDLLLVIGGCTNCCASHEQYMTKNGVVKMWDESHIEDICSRIRNIIKMEEN